jgi:DNA segregation ATPase FtsK/SpoIIIE-like protein
MILGASGAERLTGSGDLLYKDFGDPVRLQAPYLPEAERRTWFKT